jgi:hypothetical protein
MRRVDLGGLIGREGQESELFVIVNLDDIWVDLAVSPEDIASLREQQPITIRAIGIEGETPAQVGNRKAGLVAAAMYLAAMSPDGTKPTWPAGR